MLSFVHYEDERLTVEQVDISDEYRIEKSSK
jgi:hypothetical protein